MSKDFKQDFKNNNVLSTAMSMLYRHRLSMFLFVVSAAVTAYLYHKTYPSFHAKARLHIQTPEGSTLSSTVSKVSGIQHNPYMMDQYVNRYIKILSSSSFESFVANKIQQPEYLAILETTVGKNEPLPSAGELIGKVDYKKVDIDIIDVIAWSPQRVQAVNTANLMGRLAKEAIVEFESTEIEEAQKYLKIQIEESKERLDKLNTEIGDFLNKRRDVQLSISSEKSLANDSILTLQKDLEVVKVNLKRNKLLSKKLKRQIRKYTNKTVKLDDIMSSRGRTADLLKKLEAERIELDADYQALSGRLASLKQAASPEYEQKVYEFKKQLEVEYSFSQMLQKNLYELEIQNISIKNRVRAFDEATLKTSYERLTLLKRVFAAVVFALIFAIIMFVAWEHIHPVILSRKELELLGLKYLSHIPTLNKSFLGFSLFDGLIKKTKSFYLCSPNLDTPGSVAFRYLRTRLTQELYKKGEDIKVLSFVSPSSNEGKSIITSNLAISLGNIDKKVLVIDGDLRRASLSGIFNCENSSGLAEVLSGEKSFANVVVKNIFTNVDFLASGGGQANSSEYMAQGRLKGFVDSIKNQYDVILIDTPALVSGPDSLIIVESSDLQVLVAKANGTKLADMWEFVDVLASHNITRPYVVLNQYDQPFTNKAYPYYVVRRRNANNISQYKKGA